MTSPRDLRNFWREVFALRGSVTFQVLPRVLTFGGIAGAIWIVNELTHEFDFHLAVAPYEVAGAVLGLLLVLRTNEWCGEEKGLSLAPPPVRNID